MKKNHILFLLFGTTGCALLDLLWILFSSFNVATFFFILLLLYPSFIVAVYIIRVNNILWWKKGFVVLLLMTFISVLQIITGYAKFDEGGFAMMIVITVFFVIFPISIIFGLYAIVNLVKRHIVNRVSHINRQSGAKSEDGSAIP